MTLELVVPPTQSALTIGGRQVGLPSDSFRQARLCPSAQGPKMGACRLGRHPFQWSTVRTASGPVA
jgi:hypothetical protein